MTDIPQSVAGESPLIAWAAIVVIGRAVGDRPSCSQITAKEDIGLINATGYRHSDNTRQKGIKWKLPILAARVPYVAPLQ